MKKQIALIILAAFLIGCTNKNKTNEINLSMKYAPGTPLLHVGQITLSLEELRQDFLERQGSFRGAPDLNTVKKRQEYLDNYAIQLALFEEATKSPDNLLNDPGVRRNVQKLVVQELMRRKLSEAQNSYVASDEEIKDYYEKNPIHFNRDDALKVAFIAVPWGDNNQSAQKVAQILHSDANKIKDANIKEFARLAINYAQSSKSLSSGKLETNESEYLEKDAFEAKFGKDSFTKIKDLEKMGAVGPMLASNDSYYIVMKTGFRKKLNESLEEAKPKIQKRIAFEKRGEVYDKYLAEIRQKYNIKIEENLVAELSNDPNPPKNEEAHAHAPATKSVVPAQPVANAE